MFTKYGKIAVSYVAPPATNNTQVLPGLYTRDLIKGMCLVKDAGGVERAATIKNNSSGTTFRTGLSSNSYAGIYIGSGNTAASEDDYTLETPINSGVSATSNVSQVFDSENLRYIQRVELTISNSGSEDVTVNEIGYFATQYYASAVGEDASNSSALFLIDRTVLDNPVIIPAGEASIVRYDFAFPYMEAEPEPEPDPEPGE